MYVLGVFTVAVSLLRYVVPNSGHVPIGEISHMEIQPLSQCPALITKVQKSMLICIQLLEKQKTWEAAAGILLQTDIRN